MATSNFSAAVPFGQAPQSTPVLSGSTACWRPNTDVITHDTGVIIKLELAGIHREELELLVEGNRLIIRGRREDALRTAGSKFLVMEINYGLFETAIDLPSGLDVANAKASYLNGFLRIEIARLKGPSASQKIQIRDE